MFIQARPDKVMRELDQIDRKILDIIQSHFPLVSRPYAEIGRLAGISEEEAHRRVRDMRANGPIRRLGANFQSSKLGFVSTLCAASVKPAQLNDFMEKVNQIPGVTHNYEREHDWNVWFTLIAPSREAAAATLKQLEEETGVEILNLPATKFFKIRVDFQMAE